MAKAGIDLIRALRRTAARIEGGATYRWSNFGTCNCGHLAQTLTSLTPELIHRIAYAGDGDWGQQAREYCGTSGFAMDWLLSRLFEAGLSPQDVHHLERLSGPEILERVPEARKPLVHHRPADAVVYLRAWADLLESQLAPCEDQEAAA